MRRAALPADEVKAWRTKYYKGLGTSTDDEAKQYFSDLSQHELSFEWSGAGDAALIERAFAKSMADARKEWLRGYDPNVYVDHSSDKITYADFIDKELIHFSNADNVRSIPSGVDGLKPGQRKVLFSCIKRKLTSDIKVAQLAGYVSEHSAYHHGEASLAGTIVGMAQTFVGSNNIALLHPAGQFGTRLLGGKDAASPRYIFTKLPSLTRLLFRCRATWRRQWQRHPRRRRRSTSRPARPGWPAPCASRRSGGCPARRG